MDESFTQKLMVILQRPSFESIVKEIKFSASRSGGPGGQHVNKVNSKVTLRWNVGVSLSLDEEQRSRIMDKLSKSINVEGEVVLSADGSRSQLKNKFEVLSKLDRLIAKAFEFKKARKKTKPSKSSIKKRLDDKKKQGEKKKQRKDPT